MNIVKQNGRYFVFNKVDIGQRFERKNYVLDYSKEGVFLRDANDFSFPEEIFDVEVPFREKVKKSFRAVNRNLGVLLEGYKGQGKSITAKLLAKEIAEEMDMPVIMIGQELPKEVDFISFLSEIDQDYILFIDEFEKIFKKNHYGAGDDSKMHSQDVFLSFMDGAISSQYRRLFLLTTNDEISSPFINRPSRIRYYKKYEFISQELYDMILEKKLDNKEYEEDLRQNLSLVDCSIDLLNSIIEEINIQDEPYSTFKDCFNHKPKKISYRRYMLDKSGEWIYKDWVEVNTEVTRSTTYIPGISYDISVVDIHGKDIVYRVYENITGDDDDEDESKRVLVKYKLIKENNNVVSHAF